MLYTPLSLHVSALIGHPQAEYTIKCWKLLYPQRIRCCACFCGYNNFQLLIVYSAWGWPIRAETCSGSGVHKINIWKFVARDGTSNNPSILWNIMLCSPLKVSRRFGETCRLHLQRRKIEEWNRRWAWSTSHTKHRYRLRNRTCLHILKKEFRSQNQISNSFHIHSNDWLRWDRNEDRE
jgi:hypothetical protein